MLIDHQAEACFHSQTSMALEYFRNYELQAEDLARLLEDLRYRLEYLRLREEVAIYQTFFCESFI